MSPRRALAVARHEVRILRRDYAFMIVMAFMPLVLIAFIKPAMHDLHDAMPGSNGSEQAVPGMTVLFTLFLMTQVAFNFFHEHGWGTWERLRSSPARLGEVVFGKAIVQLVRAAGQLTILFVLGGLLFGLPVHGNVLALALVGGAFCVCLVTIGFALFAVCRSINQVEAIGNLGSLLIAGIGGALTPMSTLPGLVQSIAPATPGYWAMRGFRGVIVDGSGIGAAALPVMVLLLFASGFLALAVVRFRADDEKVTWA
jgi:ABC-2 type transport system permease protein